MTTPYRPMQTEINRLKFTLKRGPRMSRQMRAEFTLEQADLPTRRLSPELHQAQNGNCPPRQQRNPSRFQVRSVDVRTLPRA